MTAHHPQRRAELCFCIALAWYCSATLTAQTMPELKGEDPRLVALIDAFLPTTPSTTGEEERLDAFLFAVGTLPHLDPQSIFHAWKQRAGESRAALALALSTCADEGMITALATEVANGEARTDHTYLHVLACARRLAIESSMPSLRDLNDSKYRAQVAEDLLRANTAARGKIERARTAEFLDLFSKAGADAARSPQAARLLLERAIGLCGRVDLERAADLVRCALQTEFVELRYALWIAISFALNQGYLDPSSESKITEQPSAAQLEGAMQEAARELENPAQLTPAQRIAAGFAAAGWPMEEEPALRCGLLLEAATADAPWVRYHALRELAARARMHPDFGLIFFLERSRAHPCAAQQSPAEREARLLGALRTWAEKQYPELKR